MNLTPTVFHVSDISANELDVLTDHALVENVLLKAVAGTLFDSVASMARIRAHRLQY